MRLEGKKIFVEVFIEIIWTCRFDIRIFGFEGFLSCFNATPILQIPAVRSQDTYLQGWRLLTAFFAFISRPISSRASQACAKIKAAKMHLLWWEEEKVLLVAVSQFCSRWTKVTSPVRDFCWCLPCGIHCISSAWLHLLPWSPGIQSRHCNHVWETHVVTSPPSQTFGRRFSLSGLLWRHCHYWARSISGEAVTNCKDSIMNTVTVAHLTDQMRFTQFI